MRLPRAYWAHYDRIWIALAIICTFVPLTVLAVVGILHLLGAVHLPPGDGAPVIECGSGPLKWEC